MKMRLAAKLPAMIAGGAILAAALIATNDYFTAAKFLEKQVADNLKNVRNGRRAEVFRFLSRVHEDLEILAAGNQVRLALSDFNRHFRRIGRTGEARAQYMQHLYTESVPTGMLASTIVRDPAVVAYGKQHDIHDAWFRHIVPARDYGDLYLINHSGDVVYSVLKKGDFASNLMAGRWYDTGLARVFRGAMTKAGVAPPPEEPAQNTDVTPEAADHGGHGSHGAGMAMKPAPAPAMKHAATTHAASGDEHSGAGHAHKKLHGTLDHGTHNKELFQDVSQYSPDHGAAAGFMAVPVIDHRGHTAGALAVRFPIEQVNTIMQEASNLGRTGDAYLVGPDLLFRSQPRLETTPFVIKQAAKGGAVEAALRGREGVMTTESYDGSRVLAAYGAIAFHGARWAIISEMDLDEIHAPTHEMRRQMLLIGLLLTAVMVIVGTVLARTVTAPLSRVTEQINAFAANRAVTELEESARGDEIGDIARGFHAAAHEVAEHIDEMNRAHQKLADGEQALREREERIRSRSAPSASCWSATPARCCSPTPPCWTSSATPPMRPPTSTSPSSTRTSTTAGATSTSCAATASCRASRPDGGASPAPLSGSQSAPRSSTTPATTRSWPGSTTSPCARRRRPRSRARRRSWKPPWRPWTRGYPWSTATST